MPDLASHPLRSRVGLLLPAPASQAVWTGTANAAQSTSFVLAVTTVTGSLAAVEAGMVIVTGDGDYLRAKLDAAGGNLYLAENFTEFTAGDVLTAYNVRLPWPRYQRLDGETLYKDWDVAFPVDFRDVLPPSVVVEPGVVWAVVGTPVAMDASGSEQVNDVDVGNYVDITWDAGAWGTVSGISGTHDEYANVTANSTGWHYLKVTGADEFGATAVRYVAFVAGGTPEPVLSFDLNWTLAGGWTASGTVDGTLSGYLRHSPALLVDLDTRAVLFAGFLTAEGLTRVVNVDTASFKLLAALAEAEKLTTHACIVTDLVETATPDAWEEVRRLTVERALWYLLYWQTLIPELVNVKLSGQLTVRRIKGQKFQAGSLTALINEVLGAAMQVLRGQRTGGVDVAALPLFTAPEAWTDGSLPVLDVSDAAAREAAVELESPPDAFSDCVLSGVYLGYAGEYAPARMRAPGHPAPWGGRTATVDRLAPTSEYELQLWAARHFCAENLATRVTLRPLVTVDPGVYALADTGQAEAARIAIETLRETFNVGGLAWELQLSGRNYAPASFTAVSEPLPDPISVTPTPTPSPVPPIPFVPPVVVQEWPDVVYVATQVAGIWRTDLFGGPDEGQPTWTLDNAIEGGGTLDNIRQLGGDPTNRLYQYCVDDDTDTVYRHAAAGADWVEILSNVDVQAELGDPNAYISMFAVELDGTLWVAAIRVSTDTAYYFPSTDYGATWGTPTQGTSVGESHVLTLLVQNNYIWLTRDANRVIGKKDSTWDYLSPIAPLLCPNNYNPSEIWGANASGIKLSRWYWATDIAVADVRADIEPAGTDAMWFDPADNDHMYLLDDDTQRVYETADAWVNVDTPPALSPTSFYSLVGPFPTTFPEHLILGRRSSLDLGTTNPHTVHIMTDLDDNTPMGKAGIDPGNPATTVSIPHTGHGVCRVGGIWWVS